LLTVTGKVMSMKAWAQQMKIQYTPSMVFFNTMGREVFRTEAYLRPFHIQSALDYVSSGAYREQKEFQRYLQARADALRAKGVEVDLWK
jgi:thioredoxin-related protein